MSKARVESGIYNWSRHDGPIQPVCLPKKSVEIDDETLRDGLQGTQLDSHPTTSQRQTYLLLANKFVDHADIGFPGGEGDHKEQIAELIKFSLDKGLDLSLSCAARAAVESDIKPIIDLSHQSGGYPLEADIFLDVSEYRAALEGWDRKEKLSALAGNIKRLKKHNLPVMFVPERATSTPPEELLEACKIACDLGVDRICIADTQGIAASRGITNIFRWSLEELGSQYPNVKWDGHFHNDRGLGLANCITAVDEGVDRVHATSFCIGERSGNVDLAILLLNLNMAGFREDDLTGLRKFTQLVSNLLSYEIPPNMPVYGEGAFSTASGVHASAVDKEAMSDGIHRTYFPINPNLVGGKARVEVGPFSGSANVIFKLREMGIYPDDDVVKKILMEARKGRNLLSDTTIRGIAGSMNGNGSENNGKKH